MNLDDHPENVLSQLTKFTKTTIDSCFPPKELSNKAKKRAEQPWIDKDILKDERKQSKLFRTFRESRNMQDHQNYKNFISDTKKHVCVSCVLHS